MKRSARKLEFREAIAPVIPMAPALDDYPGADDSAPAPLVSRRDWLRYSLYVVWAAAAIAAGIGVGTLLNATHPAAATEPPAPVATATLTVSAAASLAAPSIALPSATAQASLGLAPAADVSQAQAGSPFEVVALAALHPATTPAYLQPGFGPAGLPQGQIGTAAVR